jgi:hypothetical protein
MKDTDGGLDTTHCHEVPVAFAKAFEYSRTGGFSEACAPQHKIIPMFPSLTNITVL